MLKFYNATEQNLDLGALIPAKASNVDIVIVCDEAINTGALDLAAGSASSGEQYIANANCDATTDCNNFLSKAANKTIG